MSDFVKEPKIVANGGFEYIKPIDLQSDVSQYYIVQIAGEQYFLKALREDVATNDVYRYLYNKEWEIGKQIKHQHIVKYDSFAENADGCYILMEYICGNTLTELISTEPDYFKKRQNLDRFFIQLLSAIKYLHEKQIVYSDLNPDNVMLTQVSNHVKLVDLGYCFVDKYSYTVGKTDKYQAPEHNDISQIDTRTDIYCIGKLIEYIETHSTCELPTNYQKIKNKCLKESKDERYQSIDEISHAIDNSKRSWRLWAAIGIIVASIVAISAIWNNENVKVVAENIIITDTLTVDYIKYSRFNTKEKTCVIVGCDTTDNIYLQETILYNGTEYSVTEIAENAFAEHRFIKSLYIPEGIKEIGQYAFTHCDSITTINIPNSITEIGKCAFWGNNMVKWLKLPEKIKIIPEGCFAGIKCRHINIPESVENIRLDAFALNDSLISVKLPSTLTRLERGVFYHCDNLETITIPANVEIMGEYLFYECISLKDIYNLNPTPQTILPIHKNPAQITLHVPKGSADAYRAAAHWQDMNIVEIE